MIPSCNGVKQHNLVHLPVQQDISFVAYLLAAHTLCCMLTRSRLQSKTMYQVPRTKRLGLQQVTTGRSHEAAWGVWARDVSGALQK